MTRRLMADERLQTITLTRFNEMICMSGTARPTPEDEQGRWMDVIFSEQPDLANVYPGDTRQMKEKRQFKKFEKCSKCELFGWCRSCPAVSFGYTGDMYATDPPMLERG